MSVCVCVCEKSDLTGPLFGFVCLCVCLQRHHTQQLAAAAQVGDARRVGDPRIRKKMQLMQDHREMKMPNRIKAARETGRR
jgi:hypothetical protein